MNAVKIIGGICIGLISSLGFLMSGLYALGSGYELGKKTGAKKLSEALADQPNKFNEMSDDDIRKEVFDLVMSS